MRPVLEWQAELTRREGERKLWPGEPIVVGECAGIDIGRLIAAVVTEATHADLVPASASPMPTIIHGPPFEPLLEGEVEKNAAFMSAITLLGEGPSGAGQIIREH